MPELIRIVLIVKVIIYHIPFSLYIGWYNTEIKNVPSLLVIYSFIFNTLMRDGHVHECVYFQYGLSDSYFIQ